MVNQDVVLYNQDKKTLLSFINVELKHLDKNIYAVYSTRGSFLMKIHKGDNMLLTSKDAENINSTSKIIE